ncbi:hypothetical protein HAX54_050290 [Datura stramonium]|uniref:Uncharacterized protein n=1 Tax=Datura stramonium TaxID=4076 RepID=A0ABS8WP13_DATST|nr:hypothetical protein [Datura stramonium]
MCTFTSSKSKKTVWIWTENKQVMTAAVERGWNIFIFPSNRQDLALEWSSIAVIYPLFIEEGRLIDHEHQRVAAFAEISSPQQLEQFQISEEQADKIVVNLLDWQVIPAENIVAAFQGTQKTVLAVSKTQSELKCLRPWNTVWVLLTRGLFMHIFAVPGGKTSYLSELKSGKEVIVVDQRGMQRTAIVGSVKVETRSLILVEAKVESENESYSILLQNAETVELVSPLNGEHQQTAIPVTSLKVGDEVLLLITGWRSTYWNRN